MKLIDNFVICALKEQGDRVQIIGRVQTEDFPADDQIEKVILDNKADSAIVVRRYEVAELPFE